MAGLYPLFAELPNSEVDRLVRGASHVIVESSAAALYLRRVRRLNPSARIIYYAADRLDTVGAHPFIRQRLEEDRELIDHFSLRSSSLASDFAWAGDRLFKAEFGISPNDFAEIGPSPYRGRSALISVGSMLFDPWVFQEGAERFPNVEWHVIGCGTSFRAPSNVHVHAEMPFRDTLAFVKHANAGLAPYRPAEDAEYLAESSLKLAQFEYLGVPAVCPDFARGEGPYRFGYVPGDTESLVRSVAAALDFGRFRSSRRFLDWTEVALRVLDPESHGAARLRASLPAPEAIDGQG
jgi:2-beta-glucuronyltransferase